MTEKDLKKELVLKNKELEKVKKLVMKMKDIIE
jgi:hypothetical protein